MRKSWGGEWTQTLTARSGGGVFANFYPSLFPPLSRSWTHKLWDFACLCTETVSERWKKFRCMSTSMSMSKSFRRKARWKKSEWGSAWLNSLCNCTVWRAEERTRIWRVFITFVSFRFACAFCQKKKKILDSTHETTPSLFGLTFFERTLLA